jgi:hypothetical protein
MPRNIVLQLDESSILSKDVDKTPGVDCGKVGRVNKEKVMTRVNNGSNFCWNDRHSTTSI